jgi:hypothetical protein
MITPMTRKLAQITALTAPWLLLALGALAGLLAAPAGGIRYLELQAASDGVHRIAVIAMPAGLLSALLSLLLSIVKRLGGGIRIAARTVMGCGLGVCLGVLVFIVKFDSAIEQKGTAGQMVLESDRQEEIRWNPSVRLRDQDAEYFLGPGYRYEDNVAVAAADRSSGRLRWIFHCLGNAVSDVNVASGKLSFKTHRPAVSVSYVLDLNEPRVLSFLEE